jgi:hypothetical protein
MARTSAVGGFGTKLQRSVNGTTFTDVAEIGDVEGPAITKVTDDATHMNSDDGFTEKIAVGLHEAGDVTFSMHLIETDATQNALREDAQTGTTPPYFRILFVSGKKIDFRAFVSSITLTTPMRGKIMHNVTLSLTGKPVKS